MSHTEKKEQSVLWLSFYAGLLFAGCGICLFHFQRLSVGTDGRGL